MQSREEIKEYAKKICVPLMERNAKRMERGEYALKPDMVGYIPAFLENFCRPFWGIAPIIAQGEEIYLDINGKKVSAAEYMREVLSKGFAEDGTGWESFKEYFNAYTYENQNITELAGLLVGIWFAREQLWEPIEKSERDRYANELYKMAVEAFDHSWPNNHYWFPLFTVTVLKRLGYDFPETERMLSYGLDFLDKLYLGKGWYFDGEFGRFDYYEAWSLHMYPLLWTLIADESFKDYQKHKEEYIRRTNKFLKFYTHWFDERGAQVPFGRSLSYRFAASSLFPIAVMAGCDIEPELAGRVLSKNIEYFKENCKLEESGILPEGYMYKAYGVTEGYTSDGGAYWCCKSFLSLLMDKEHPFWQTEKAKLPSEKGNYTVRPEHDKINLVFTGNDGIVTMYNNTTQYYQNHMHTHRFGDMRSWYGKFAYNSASGFGCSVPDVISLDSMIGLITPDEAMTSHRLGFDDLGYEGEFLHSQHIPFSNDRETKIETWILPMGASHVRIHKVKLNQSYSVSEGGFGIGRWDDYLPVNITDNSVTAENRELYSRVSTVSNAEIKYMPIGTQPNYHIYAPLAAYPAYRTKEPLEKGEYIFASVFTLDWLKNKGKPLPKVEIDGMEINITDGERKVTLCLK